MELALSGRLDLLKAADLDAFLDATLACLRLVQNILEHPHNERYRRLRGSAPVSARADTCSVWRAGSACTPPLCMCVIVRAFTIKYHAFCCMRECVVHAFAFRTSAFNRATCSTSRLLTTCCACACHLCHRLLLLSLSDSGTTWSHRCDGSHWVSF